MINVGDLVNVDKGGILFLAHAKVLYKPMATGDCWGFLDRASQSEIWTSEGITIRKQVAHQVNEVQK